MENVNTTSINTYRFGRKVISIPCSKNMINENLIKKYLGKIMELHQANVRDYKHLNNVYIGKQNIWDKKRPYSSNKPNYIVVENHAFSMVEFKKGYMYGNDVKYSCAEDTMCTDDITWLNKYMKDQRKAMKNVELAEDIYKVGAGNRIILPKPMGSNYDIERNAPFDIYNLDYCSSFVVYSSNYTKDKLFGGIITTIDSPDPDDIKYEIMIYDDNYSYRFECGNYLINQVEYKFISKKRHYIGMCPIIEFKLNKARIGIIEVVETLFDAINTISSNTVDNVADVVNSLLIFYNMDVDSDDIKELLEAGGMSANNSNPSTPAEVKYLINALDNADVNTKYDSIVTVAYDIVGVPRASSSTTSGGDTGEARLLGGGWTRADVVASQDTISLREDEREMLDVVISICNKHPYCKVNSIYPSDIEITFCRTKNDNLLVKAQSLKYMYDMGMPKEAALNISGISSTTHELAHDWEEYEKTKENENKEVTNIDVTKKENPILVKEASE